MEYVKGQDVLLKLDKDHKLKGLYGELDPKAVQEALLIGFIKTCEALGEDWRGTMFNLGLNAFQKEFDKEEKDVSTKD